MVAGLLFIGTAFPEPADVSFDLLIHAGRIVCPKTGLNGPGSVGVRGDRIVTVGPQAERTATRVLDFPEGVLLPGLIDLHAHPAKTGSVFGVDPDRFLLPRGTTTAMSQGDAGARNLRQFVEETIAATRTRVILAINLSMVGESTSAGCFVNLEHANVDACVQAVEENREHIWGIAVNVSRSACGDTDPRAVLRRGFEAAQRTGLPILFGMRRFKDWPVADQLILLRPGDVVTYCFRREPHCIVEGETVHPAVRDARQRGILFDVGHGTASFDFDVAEAAIRNDFPPDTISTDWQAKHVGCEPTHDLPRVVSKLMAAGMPERDAFAAVTAKPAEILRNAEIGSLTVGACADLTVLGCDDDEQLNDVNGNQRRGRCWRPLLTIRAGASV